MVRNPFFVTIFIACFYPISVVAEDTNVVDSLKAALISEMVQESHNQLVKELTENGLSSQDAEQIVVDFATTAANCIFEAAQQSVARRSLDFDKLLVGLDVRDFKSLFRDETEFKELVEPCAYTALENTGVRLD